MVQIVLLPTFLTLNTSEAKIILKSIYFVLRHRFYVDACYLFIKVDPNLFKQTLFFRHLASRLALLKQC